jgi:hypothetical protein
MPGIDGAMQEAGEPIEMGLKIRIAVEGSRPERRVVRQGRASLVEGLRVSDSVSISKAALTMAMCEKA